MDMIQFSINWNSAHTAPCVYYTLRTHMMMRRRAEQTVKWPIHNPISCIIKNETNIKYTPPSVHCSELTFCIWFYIYIYTPKMLYTYVNTYVLWWALALSLGPNEENIIWTEWNASKRNAHYIQCSVISL